VQEQFKPERAFQKNVLADLKIQYPYAYHFNASLLAHFLTDYGIKHGVEQIVDDVEEVKLRENGFIDHLVLKEQGNLKADLFIDCTGFRGLLINQTLKEPFIPFSESLLCDRAVAMQVPKDIQKTGINPYTTATALSAGWVWNIPLYGRDGTGYVYSSAFLSQDQAEEEFRKHLGSASDGLNALHIKMRVGRDRNSWVKNCVAIGLSSGFVEPLESTGIFFIQHGIEELIGHFPDKEFDSELISSYNRAVARCIDGVREFLTLHYVGSTRADTPFWKATNDLLLPGDLDERLRLWKIRLPNNRTINTHYHGFEAYSYSVMLLGLGYRPQRHLPILDQLDDRNVRAAFQTIKEKANYLSNNLPSQFDYLTSVSYEVAA
jgi:tryptophan halogenase